MLFQKKQGNGIFLYKKIVPIVYDPCLVREILFYPSFGTIVSIHCSVNKPVLPFIPPQKSCMQKPTVKYNSDAAEKSKTEYT